MAARGPVSLRARAVSWLAGREYSVIEIRRKLLLRLRAEVGAAPGELATVAQTAPPADAQPPPPAIESQVDEVIDWLLQRGYLDEGRFVASRIHVRSSRFGVARIAQELSRHGLDLPPETATALRASELERASAVWQRRFGEPPRDLREAAKQARFLAGRGFSSDVVRRVLRASGRNQPGDHEPI